MKYLLQVIFAVLLSKGYSQTHKVLFGDTSCMRLMNTELKYYVFKNGIQNGKWVAYYDSSFTHKAVECKIRKGKKEGHYYYWSENGVHFYDVKYKKGKQHGLDIRKHTDKEGKEHYLISKFKKGIMIETLRDD